MALSSFILAVWLGGSSTVSAKKWTEKQSICCCLRPGVGRYEWPLSARSGQSWPSAFDQQRLLAANIILAFHSFLKFETLSSKLG